MPISRPPIHSNDPVNSLSENLHLPESPLIIIGMHRSGTSLITDLIGRAGVFIGADAGGIHAESQCFLRSNQNLLQMAHANWDNPEPMQWSLQDSTVQRAMVHWLKDQFRKNIIHDYTSENSESEQYSKIFAQPWGWKDPRNTITLPLWLSLFPTAKVLNIVRNGLAVSTSLVTRELRRHSRLDSPARSSRCLRHDRAFDLWVEYVQTAANYCNALEQQQMMTIIYEDFLNSPKTHLSSILNFAGVSVTDSLISELCSNVDESKATEFLNDPIPGTFRPWQSNHPLMVSYGYSSVERSIA